MKTDSVHFGLGNFFELISRAKIGLNCHFYDEKTTPLEIHRIMEMISTYTLVLTARSGDKWLDNIMSPIVTFYDNEEDLILKFRHLNSLSEAERWKLTMHRLRLFQKMPTFKQNFLASDSVLFKKQI